MLGCCWRPKLGIPLHLHGVIAQLRAHDPLVVVLAQRQHERKRAQGLADLPERDALPPTFRWPTFGTGASRPAQRLVDDAIFE